MTLKKKILLFSKHNIQYVVEKRKPFRRIKKYSLKNGQDLVNGARMNSSNTECIDKSALYKRRIKPLDRIFYNQAKSLILKNGDIYDG